MGDPMVPRSSNASPSLSTLALPIIFVYPRETWRVPLEFTAVHALGRRRLLRWELPRWVERLTARGRQTHVRGAVLLIRSLCAVAIAAPAAAIKRTCHLILFRTGRQLCVALRRSIVVGGLRLSPLYHAGSWPPCREFGSRCIGTAIVEGWRFFCECGWCRGWVCD